MRPNTQRRGLAVYLLFHVGSQFGFLFSDRQVGASWRRLGRVHRLPDVVPRCRSAVDLQVPWPRRINPWVEVGQNPLRGRLLLDPTGLRNCDLRIRLVDWAGWLLQ